MVQTLCSKSTTCRTDGSSHESSSHKQGVKARIVKLAFSWLACNVVRLWPYLRVLLTAFVHWAFRVVQSIQYIRSS